MSHQPERALTHEVSVSDAVIMDGSRNESSAREGIDTYNLPTREKSALLQ